MQEKITWENCEVPLGELRPWSDNPRYSTKAQARRILESFKSLGQFQTLAIGPDNEVYDGHQRLSALLTIYGPEYVVSARRSSRSLSDEERRRLSVSAHVGATGSWDWDKLSSWDASALGEWGMDKTALDQWNADAAQLRNMLEFGQPTEADDDAVEGFADAAQFGEQRYCVTAELSEEQFGDIDLKQRLIEALEGLSLIAKFERLK